MKPLLHAPKLNAAKLPWFNTRAPLDLSDFKGKLAILDFWTYCCINCIHVIPTLKRIEENFPDSVVVVGIHSPKFPGEKNTRNLEQAIHRYEIEHPVVQDVDFCIWKNYAIRGLADTDFSRTEWIYSGRVSRRTKSRYVVEYYRWDA